MPCGRDASLGIRDGVRTDHPRCTTVDREFREDVEKAVDLVLSAADVGDRHLTERLLTGAFANHERSEARHRPLQIQLEHLRLEGARGLADFPVNDRFRPGAWVSAAGTAFSMGWAIVKGIPARDGRGFDVGIQGRAKCLDFIIGAADGPLAQKWTK